MINNWGQLWYLDDLALNPYTKLGKNFILKTKILQSQNCVKRQGILWDLDFIDLFILSCNFFFFLIKAFACEILIKVRNGSKGEYIRQYRYQSESGTCYKHKLHPRILKKRECGRQPDDLRMICKTSSVTIEWHYLFVSNVHSY